MTTPGQILRNVLRAAAFAPLGWAGSVAQARFVGGTSTGPPASGAYQARDFVVDGERIHVCTSSGSPGTWKATATQAEHDLLKARVDDLEADVLALQGDVSNLYAAIGALESRVSTLESP